MDYFAVAGGGVDDGSSAGGYSYVSFYNNNITRLDGVEVGDLGVSSCISPAG